MFCGRLFRKYPTMELQGLLQYTVVQLKVGSYSRGVMWVSVVCCFVFHPCVVHE